MSLASLLLERFKVRTRAVENPVITSVGTTATLVLANNPNRLGFIVINLSTDVMYIGLTHEVSSSKGIRLDASGGFWAGIWDELFDPVAWAWWLISTGEDSAVFALEIVEY